MISLERLLDGLDVEVEPFFLDGARRKSSLDDRHSAPSVRCTPNGSGVLELVGGAIVRVSTHSAIVLPPRHRARQVPRPASPAPAARGPLSARTAIAAGNGDHDVVVVSGRIRASYKGSVGLFDHLREPLVEPLTAGDPLHRSFQELLDEIAAQRPGSRAMAEALVRRCLILLLRRYCERGERRVSWLTALEDARLGRAVAAMQDRPEHAFSVPRLAEVAGMSRSVFAACFADAFGQSPMEFLRTLRLARATQLLTGTNLPVKTVAARVGYSSRSSFTRAFVARHGIGPTGFRAMAGQPAPVPPVAGPQSRSVAA